MKKLALNAGHYLGTEDRRCLKEYDPNETQEWTLNDRVADRIEELLSAYEIEVLRIDDTTGQKYISVNDRTPIANKWGTDLWIGIHHNIGIYGGRGGGISVYVYTKPDKESLEWQKGFYNSLMKETPELKGNRATPLAKGNLAECRDTEMPSVLFELGFMDSPTDIPFIIADDHADKCARAIVNELVSKWELKLKVVEKPEEKVDEGVNFGSRKFVNGNKTTKVYSNFKCTSKIGSLDPLEEVECLKIIDGKYIVLYSVNKSKDKKVGFVKGFEK